MKLAVLTSLLYIINIICAASSGNAHAALGFVLVLILWIDRNFSIKGD